MATPRIRCLQLPDHFCLRVVVLSSIQLLSSTSLDVIWQGPVAGVDVALETFKAEKAYPMSRLHDVLPDMIKRCPNLFHNKLTATSTYTELEAFHRASLAGKVKELSSFTQELRWIKSPAELKLMRESAAEKSKGCKGNSAINSCINLVDDGGIEMEKKINIFLNFFCVIFLDLFLDLVGLI